MKKNHLSESSGIIASMVMYDYDGPSCVTVKGSYTALSCNYLSYVDEDFARDQYDKFKTRFLKKWPPDWFQEYEHIIADIGKWTLMPAHRFRSQSFRYRIRPWSRNILWATAM